MSPVNQLLPYIFLDLFAQAMFDEHKFKEGQTRQIVINDADPDAMLSLIEFAYTDKIKGEDISIEVLAAADKYDMKALFKICQRELCNQIDVNNAANFFAASYLHQKAKILKSTATKFIVNNYSEVKKTHGFATICEVPKAVENILDAFHSKLIKPNQTELLELDKCEIVWKLQLNVVFFESFLDH